MLAPPAAIGFSPMPLPRIDDFTAQALDPARYVRLGGDWWIACADVQGSTALAQAGRDREVNFVAGAMVAVVGGAATSPDQPAAAQFGGDGAVVAVPPDRVGAVRAVLAALGHWAAHDMDIPLRVALVPVAALDRAGYPVLAALQDFGHGNVFGQFLGPGVAQAEHWMKADARWHVGLADGALPGLDELSCRWRPVPARRGHVLCVIIDPVDGADAALAPLMAAMEAVVPTNRAAPLGDGAALAPALTPAPGALDIELRGRAAASRLGRMVRAVAGTAILGTVHRLGGRAGGLDIAGYRRAMAERSDYRKLAGGPRLVLDVTGDEDARLEALLSAAEAAGTIRFGLSRARATTITCMVGDFAADRHVHFVDGDGLGFWRAAVALKAKIADKGA